MKINILGGSTQAKYKALNSQRTINWYPIYANPEDDKEENKNQVALYPTPGSSSFVDIGTGTYWRALFTAVAPTVTKCFAIRDNVLYEINENKTTTTLGTMVNIAYGSSPIYMTINNNSEVGIFHKNCSYVWDILASTLTKITDEHFPGEVTYAIGLDTYNVVIAGGVVFVSLTGNATSWVGTQTFAPTVTSSPAVALGALREQLYVFTKNSIETWVNTGGDTVFERQQKATMYIGIAAKDSLATCDEGFFFLGSNAHGECAPYYFNGDASCIIIPESDNIVWRLNQLGYTPTDATGSLVYSKTGNVFYKLTVPDLETTFVYDLKTKRWHEQQSKRPSNDSNGDPLYSFHRGQYYTNFNGLNLYADKYSSKILIEDYDEVTEDDQRIIRKRYSQTTANDQKLITWSELELEYDPGQLSSNYNLQVAVSFNGGLTFQQPRIIGLGSQGNYDYRLRVFKLGSGRNTVFSFTSSDPVDLMIHGATVHGSIGAY